MVRLRTADGVNFTKAGARKLAHFVEGEIRRNLDAAEPKVDPAVVTVPAEAPADAAAAPVEAPAAVVKPVAGPVLPLTGARLRAGRSARDACQSEGDGCGPRLHQSYARGRKADRTQARPGG